MFKFSFLSLSSFLVLIKMLQKYAALVMEDAPKWGGEDGIGQQVIQLFKHSPSELWEYFKCVSGEIPDINKIHEYNGFVMTGSHYSANDDLPWIHKVMQFIRELYDMQCVDINAPKLVGICFGHQLINRALGGRVAKNECNKFILKQGDINISNELLDKSYYRDIFGTNSILTLIQSHSEEIGVLPMKAKCVGSSPECPNEIVMYGEKILTFQGHSEITIEQASELILPAIIEKGKFSEEQVVEYWNSVNNKQNDTVKCREMIKQFLNT